MYIYRWCSKFFYKIAKLLDCQHITLAKLCHVFCPLVSILCGCRIDCHERSSKAKKTFCNGFTSLLHWSEGRPTGFFATYSKSGQLHQLGRFRFSLIFKLKIMSKLYTKCNLNKYLTLLKMFPIVPNAYLKSCFFVPFLSVCTFLNIYIHFLILRTIWITSFYTLLWTRCPLGYNEFDFF